MDEQRKDEEDIAKTSLIESLQKQADEEIYVRQVTEELFDYCNIATIEKKKLRRYALK